jgi:4'-phosphopantetheinyl transferase EntD
MMCNQVLLLPENEVHLWYFHTGKALDGSEHQAFYYLDAQEGERYHRFLSPNKRQQFLASRVLLKQLLSRYTGKSPEKLALKYSLQQKPFLEENVHFNISHSGKHLLIGLARQAIGVDIQEAGVVREEHVFQGLSLQEQQQVPYEGLYPYWVLREALWKADNKETRVAELLNALPFEQALNSCSFSFTFHSCHASYLKLSHNLHIGWVVNHPQPILRLNAVHMFSSEKVFV